MALTRAALLAACLPLLAVGDTGSCEPGDEACASSEEDTDQALLQMNRPGVASNASLLERSNDDNFDCFLELMKCGQDDACLGGVEAKCSNQDSWFPTAFCNTSSSDCPLSSITEPTMVYPGGASECMTGSPYGFYVQPGARKDKLVLNFQGGGACFSPTNLGQICAQRVTFGGYTLQSSSATDTLKGIFNPNNPLNQWRDYTIVQVMFCSGDSHAGNVTHADWPGAGPGTPVPQRGYYNTMATLTWVKKNFPNLSDLVLSGESAGALGAIAWASKIFTELKPQTAIYVGDSQTGVSSPITANEGAYFLDINACGLGLWDALPGWVEKRCKQGTLSWQALTSVTIRKNPDVQFRLMQSKYDIIDIFFYSILAIENQNTPPLYLTPRDQNTYYTLVNNYIKPYVVRSNFQMFFVNAMTHQFLHRDVFFTTTANGIQDFFSNRVRMSSWTFSLAGTNECAGLPNYGQLPNCFSPFLLLDNCANSWCNLR